MDGGSWVRGGIRRGGLIALLFLAVGIVAIGSGRAAAQDDDGAAQVVQGPVRFEHLVDGERVRDPIADVRIVVETPDGELVAEGVTDETGQYEIPIAEPGTYTVRMDTESLPEGVTLIEGRTHIYEDVQIRANSNTTRAFFLGEELRAAEGRLSILPQTLANGVRLAMIIAVTSIGLSLIYGTTGLVNFAHAEMVTFGALIAYGFNRIWAGWHLIPAALIAIVVTGLAGGVFERGLWRPLRSKGVSLTSMMIISIGVGLALRHLFLFRVGGAIVNYTDYVRQPDLIEFGPIGFAPRSVWILGLSLLVLLGVALFLLRTRFGKAIRAVSDNPPLASSSGIDANRVILVVWVLGGALAGLGGVFYGLEYGARWDMGWTLLLLMFAAITLGGLGNAFGALVGALVIGIFVELWTWIVPDATDMKNVGALVGLIIILLIRPHGILGSRERVG